MFTVYFKGCTNGFTLFPHTGKCYKAVWNGGGITRSDAHKECSAEGGFLASIHDAKTNVFLLSLLKVRSYIGAVYNNGQWTWSDGSAWDFEIWRSGDPKNPSVLNYGEFDWQLTGAWHNEDNIIGYDNGYICQKDTGKGKSYNITRRMLSPRSTKVSINANVSS